MVSGITTSLGVGALAAHLKGELYTEASSSGHSIVKIVFLRKDALLQPR